MFKRHPDYTWVLEHTSQAYAWSYINFIKTTTNITEETMIQFCKLNDSVGSPETFNFGFVTASPSNFRYIFHAHLILSYLQTLNLPITNIIEVGGGYGGLCLAIHFFADHYKVKVNSYKIIDLEAVTRLDRLYLSKVNPSLSVECVDSATFGKTIQVEDGFLISNYCFSELPLELRQRYMRHLFGKIAHGFMAWNCIPLYDFGFSYKEETEYPLTGAFNKYVYF
jgi:hypothetical protein